MSKSRITTWFTLILGAIGLLLVAIPSLWLYMGATATALHPDPLSVPSVARTDPPPKFTTAVEHGQQIVSEALTRQNLPGLSVAVGIGDEIVWAEGFGYADLDNRVPVTPDHRFRIGTASNVLTSTAVGLLMEQGRLKLDEEIQTYVPAFPEKQWPVTLRHLMAHLAGVKNDGGDEGTLLGQQCDKVTEALPHFADSSLLFEPGTKSRYSSYGWILVSAAVEAAARTPFLTFMQDRIFTPLNLRDTLPDSTSTPIPNRVSFYFPRFAADPAYGLHPMRDLNFTCYAGASAFLSTPSDLVRFAMAINRGKLLKPNTVALLQTSQRLKSGEQTGYGLGWDLETLTLAGEPTPTAGHNGNVMGGPIASLLTVPKHGIVVAVTSNISYTDTFTLATKIAQTFAEQKSSR